MSCNTIAGRPTGFGGRAWHTAGGFARNPGLARGPGGRSRPPVADLDPRGLFEGKELFEKSWEPGKPSPTGGDGLGPLYNETSCVGCHHQGGTGGGGDNSRNVLMLTAVAGSAESLRGATVFQGEMEDLHPGFRNRASIVLHRHATDAERWRSG